MDTKSRVLKVLTLNTGFVSGEAISRSLGITRAAVSFAVKGLREEGYIIDSVTNRGYRLKYSPDLLTGYSVGVHLEEERMESVFVFNTIDSTNNELMRRAIDTPPDGTVIIADRQTGGRGRRGRSFDSPGGMGIYMSYLVRPADNIRSVISESGNTLIWASITSWTAVAVAEAVEEVCGVLPGIKWVNDLYLNGYKICGILTQMNTSAENNEVDSIVIGIGINVRQEREDFPDDIRNTAGSIFTETGCLVSRSRLAAAMITSLDNMRSSWPYNMELYHKKYADNSLVIGRNVTLSSVNGSCEAVVTGIDNDFGLIVRMPDGQSRHIISGEVTLRMH